MVTSRIISEMKGDNGQKSQLFHTASELDAPVTGIPYENCHGKLKRQSYQMVK